MSELRDPRRLFDDPASLPEGLPDGFADALRALPSARQMEKLAHGVGHAIRPEALLAPKALGVKAVLVKWVGVALLGGLMTYGSLHATERVLERASPSPSTEVTRSVQTAPVREAAEHTTRLPAQHQGALDARGARPPSIEPLPAGPAQEVPAPTQAARVAGQAPRPRLAGARPILPTVPRARVVASRAVASTADASPLMETAPEDELGLIRAAQAALARQPARALTLLQRHALLMPHGAFAEERDVLYLDALQALGRTAERTAQARAFLRDHPQSMHVARVRAMLVEPP